MKIALLHNLYGKYSRGGAETAVKLMAENFQAAGHQVFIITTRPRRAQAADALPIHEEAGKKIYYLKSEFYHLNRHSGFYRAAWQIGNFFAFRKAKKIKQILTSEKPDLAVTHNLMGLGWLTPLILKKLKIRHEHFLHDIQLLHPSGLIIFGQEQKINYWAAKIYQALTRGLFSAAAKVISPSRWLLEMHKQRGFFKDSEQETRPFSWPGKQNAGKADIGPIKNFLFIGQIEKQKGILLLIETFKKIDEADLTLTVAIRGGGQGLERAKKISQDDGRIKLLGPLSYEETEKIMADSDCLIVPSLCYENSPTVIYGAHAAGLPVIAARLGGIPEIMASGDAMFSPGDQNDLREKILALAHNR